MLSPEAEKIIKEVNDCKKGTDIDSLLKNFATKPEKEFIQKYAETEIAVIGGVDAFVFAIITGIVAIMLSVALFSYQENFKGCGTLYDVVRFLYALLLLILIIIYFYALYFIIKNSKLFKINVFKEIIYEIEDNNMPKKPTCYFSNKNLYRIQKLRFWYMQSIKDRINGFKDVLYLEREDRKRLIEVILIVGSILIALKTPETISGDFIRLKDNNITELFMLFLLLSVLYFILIQKDDSNKFGKKFVSFVGFVIAMIFSAIMASFLAISIAKDYIPSTAGAVYYLIFTPYWLIFTIIFGVALREK